MNNRIVISIFILILIISISSISLYVFRKEIGNLFSTKKQSKESDEDDKEIPIEDRETEILTKEKTFENITEYKGLNKNPNQLAVGVMSNYNDNISFDDLDASYILNNTARQIRQYNHVDLFTEVFKYDLDLCFILNFNIVEMSKYCTDFSLVKDNVNYNNIYKEFEVNYIFDKISNNKSNLGTLQHNFYFNKKINVNMWSAFNRITINENNYFYVIFEIINLTKTKSIELKYLLKIVVTYVKKEDEEELKKKLRKAIYVVDPLKNVNNVYKFIEIPEVRYSDKIIKTGDTIDFRIRTEPGDRRNLKYMLLFIKK